MPVTQANRAQASQIERPSCPRCLTRMWLARISPRVAGQEWRTFECPVCDVSTDAARVHTSAGTRIDF